MRTILTRVTRTAPDWTFPLGQIIDDEPPGTWRMVCGKCQRRWTVVLPETNARRFCREMSCECGANYMALSVHRGVYRGPDSYRRELDLLDPPEVRP